MYTLSMVSILVQENAGKIRLQRSTVTNSMVLELRMKLGLLFSRVVYFGLKDHLLLQGMIPECAKVTVGLMMIGYKEKGGSVIAHIEKLSQ